MILRSRPISGSGRGELPRRAFTLVELILVIALLGIVAAVALPRMGGMEERRARSEAATVQSLLSVAAQRELTSAEPLAVVYDGANATLSVQVRRVQSGAGMSSGRSGGAAGAVWVNDPLITPVRLSLLEVRSASARGERLPSNGWRVVFPQTEPRPSLQLVLGARGGGNAGSWVLDLPPESPAARLGDGAPRGGVPGVLPEAVDLDATGRGNEAW